MAKGEKMSAEATIAIPLYCECGLAFLFYNDGTMECIGRNCGHRGTRYRIPKITLQLAEVPAAEGAD